MHIHNRQRDMYVACGQANDGIMAASSQDQLDWAIIGPAHMQLNAWLEPMANEARNYPGNYKVFRKSISII